MGRGNVKLLTALGEALVEGFSDVGSTPTASTKIKIFSETKLVDYNEFSFLFDSVFLIFGTTS